MFFYLAGSSYLAVYLGNERKRSWLSLGGVAQLRHVHDERLRLNTRDVDEHRQHDLGRRRRRKVLAQNRYVLLQNL